MSVEALQRQELEKAILRRGKFERRQKPLLVFSALVVTVAVGFQLATDLALQPLLNAAAYGFAALAFLWSMELARLRLDVVRRQRSYHE